MPHIKVAGGETLGVHQHCHLLTQQGPPDTHSQHKQVGIDTVNKNLIIVLCAAVEMGLECHPASPILPSSGGVVRAIRVMHCSAKQNSGWSTGE